MYTLKVLTQEEHYIMEYPTDIFRFFADIDIKDYAWSEEKFKLHFILFRKLFMNL